MPTQTLIKHEASRIPRRGLTLNDFTQIAIRGFGDARNSYPHSMAWFDGYLYVGTTRDNLCLVNARNPLKMNCWPVRCTSPPDPQELRAQIWRYDPRVEKWEMVHISPMIMRNGKEEMRDIGYRGMAVFQGKSDGRPVLYLSSWSATGSRFIRSEDGRSFTDVSEPGLGHPSMVCFRTLQAFNGRLYTSPVGRAGHGPNEAELPVILETDDPAGGQWRTVNHLGFGHPGNLGIFEMTAFNGYLYAGTLNPATGFELWKTRAESSPPYTWTRVLTSGAYRGIDNEGVASLFVFNGALYVGTGIAGGGYNRYHKVGPAASEVIRVYPDDTWELLVGAPRVTPEGFKIPLSGLGPGFNNFFNGYTWRMCVHEEWLYVATYNWGCFLPFLTFEGFPEALVQQIQKVGVEELTLRSGGCELWRTRDGIHWHPVSLDGFGTPFNFGIRNMSSTPSGLFVGTANPFGPLVGVKTESGWKYQPNPRGGCEIWIGKKKNQERGTESPLAQKQKDPERAAMRIVHRQFDREFYADRVDDFYEKSDFDQMGYWEDGAQSARQACEHLMDRLLKLLGPVSGRILDVDCGRGGSTRYLIRKLPPQRITATGYRNPLWRNLEREQPGLSFIHHMDTADMDFPDGTFGGILCVERAGFFPHRASFLKEAFRILQPGGRLVLADTLYSRTGELTDWSRNKGNYLRDVNAYHTLLEKIGFSEVQVIDATRECAESYHRYISRTALDRFRAREIDTEVFNGIMSHVNRSLLNLRYYVLAAATKHMAG
ncbi:MAG TPA: methyltransferase domain-containing protein [Nitrospiria bacterium]|nr:methyltransferase domain-containing protein [Nitrospiria bacterium]